MVWLFFLMFNVPGAQAAQVAFLENYDARGQLIQYEPGSRFGHTAVSILQGRRKAWLNAHPEGGVAVISERELHRRGQVAAIVEIPQEIQLQDYRQYWGKPFDYKYSWTDDALYCTELIGKLLHLKPHPMHFNMDVWPEPYQKLEGTPGLSPDQLYRQLTGKDPWDL